MAYLVLPEGGELEPRSWFRSRRQLNSLFCALSASARAPGRERKQGGCLLRFLWCMRRTPWPPNCMHADWPWQKLPGAQ
jgi:hypothetical protein